MRLAWTHGKSAATIEEEQQKRQEKKTGLLVRGQLGDHLRIDATLIDNTSWLR